MLLFMQFAVWNSLQAPYRLPAHAELAARLQVTRLLATYLQRYALCPIFTEEEVEHYLMPVDDVVDSYVVESAGGLHVSTS